MNVSGECVISTNISTVVGAAGGMWMSHDYSDTHLKISTRIILKDDSRQLRC